MSSFLRTTSYELMLALYNFGSASCSKHNCCLTTRVFHSIVNVLARVRSFLLAYSAKVRLCKRQRHGRLGSLMVVADDLGGIVNDRRRHGLVAAALRARFEPRG